MENKKLGILIIIISLVFFLFLIYFSIKLNGESIGLGCNPSEECINIKNLFTFTNIGFGFFGFILALGFYLLFFNKTEKAIFKRLEDDTHKRTEEEKFELIVKALNDYEERVLRAVKGQNGITQNTLRLRTDMSKAKLSYVLQELEKRKLIKRKPKGKTLEVWLRV